MKIEEAREILRELGVPAKQQSDICCFALLALAGMSEGTSWSEATDEWMRIHDILVNTKERYGKTYAENSRETFRKQALHHFRNAAFIEDNDEPTNSPNYRYRLTAEMLELVRSYGHEKWKNHLSAFIEKHGALKELYASKKRIRKIPVMINSREFMFSTGRHNQLQKAILEEFAPRFAPGSECLYVGDTEKKDLVKNEEMLRSLGFCITLHDKMPDVVLYSFNKNWIYFIEAVTSVGPIDSKRLLEIKEMTASVASGMVFVTAFPDFSTYKKFAASLAWETEIWIAEIPDHMIHMNGDRFIGPRK